MNVLMKTLRRRIGLRFSVDSWDQQFPATSNQSTEKVTFSELSLPLSIHSKTRITHYVFHFVIKSGETSSETPRGARVIDIVNTVRSVRSACPSPLRSREIRLHEIQSQPVEVCLPQIRNEPDIVGCNLVIACVDVVFLDGILIFICLCSDALPRCDCLLFCPMGVPFNR